LPSFRPHCLLLICKDDPAAAPVNLKWQLPGIVQRFPNRRVPLRRRQKQHEAAPPGAEELPSDRPRRAAVPIPAINPLIGDAEPERPLEFPPLVQEPPQVPDVAIAPEGASHLAGKVAHAAENLPLLAAPVALLLQDSIGAPLPIGVPQQR